MHQKDVDSAVLCGTPVKALLRCRPSSTPSSAKNIDKIGCATTVDSVVTMPSATLCSSMPTTARTQPRPCSADTTTGPLGGVRNGAPSHVCGHCTSPATEGDKPFSARRCRSASRRSSSASGCSSSSSSTRPLSSHGHSESYKAGFKPEQGLFSCETFAEVMHARMSRTGAAARRNSMSFSQARKPQGEVARPSPLKPDASMSVNRGPPLLEAVHAFHNRGLGFQLRHNHMSFTVTTKSFDEFRRVPSQPHKARLDDSARPGRLH